MGRGARKATSDMPLRLNCVASRMGSKGFAEMAQKGFDYGISAFAVAS